MPAIRKIRVQELTGEAFEPFGWTLGIGRPSDRFEGQTATLWHEHDFDVGVGGVVEFLWIQYERRGFRVERLESHRLTEQAVIPVGREPIVHVVCPPPEDPMVAEISPDVDRMAAFLLDGTKGVCMRRGCWHWPFPLVKPANYLLITRRSTTLDLYSGRAPAESIVKDLGELTDTVFELTF